MADSAAIEAPTRARTGFVYGLMIAVTAALYLLICQYGERLMPPAARPSLAQTPVHSGRTDEMLHVLMALAVVIVLARLLGVLFRRLHQPPVVGEILAGIMLGPSLLGRFAPETYHYLLPASVAPFLNVLSQVG